MESLARFLDKVKDLDISKGYFDELDSWCYKIVEGLKQHIPMIALKLK